MPDPITIKGIREGLLVTVGDADATQVRVLSGLHAGETIAVNNQAELFDGSAVSTR